METFSTMSKTAESHSNLFSFDHVFGIKVMTSVCIRFVDLVPYLRKFSSVFDGTENIHMPLIMPTMYF